MAAGVVAGEALTAGLGVPEIAITAVADALSLLASARSRAASSAET